MRVYCTYFCHVHTWNFLSVHSFWICVQTIFWSHGLIFESLGISRVTSFLIFLIPQALIHKLWAVIGEPLAFLRTCFFSLCSFRLRMLVWFTDLNNKGVSNYLSLGPSFGGPPSCSNESFNYVFSFRQFAVDTHPPPLPT